MATFTSSLPDDLLQQLAEKANTLSIPKNKLIERALRLYLEHLTRVEYLQSFKEMTTDEESLQMVEEGLAAYLKQLEG